MRHAENYIQQLSIFDFDVCPYARLYRRTSTSTRVPFEFAFNLPLTIPKNSVFPKFLRIRPAWEPAMWVQVELYCVMIGGYSSYRIFTSPAGELMCRPTSFRDGHSHCQACNADPGPNSATVRDQGHTHSHKLPTHWPIRIPPSFTTARREQ